MGAIASQITSLTIVYSTVYSDADQRKHQSSASLAFVWGIHRDRWIPRTKGQLRGKCFHLMTSSCFKGTRAQKVPTILVTGWVRIMCLYGVPVYIVWCHYNAVNFLPSLHHNLHLFTNCHLCSAPSHWSTAFHIMLHWTQSYKGTALYLNDYVIYTN